MDPEDADQAPEARPPLLEDLVSLCRNLNDARALYVVIGGMAVIQAGFGRATNDIDLLIDTSPDNQNRVRKALMALPDQAVRDMTPEDLDRYVVVRVADEIVVDLMKSACGIMYAEASKMIGEVEIEGVRIPFANARLLWLTKDTVRDKDKVDRAFLAQLLAARGDPVE